MCVPFSLFLWIRGLRLCSGEQSKIYMLPKTQVKNPPLRPVKVRGRARLLLGSAQVVSCLCPRNNEHLQFTLYCLLWSFDTLGFITEYKIVTVPCYFYFLKKPGQANSCDIGSGFSSSCMTQLIGQFHWIYCRIIPRLWCKWMCLHPN